MESLVGEKGCRVPISYTSDEAPTCIVISDPGHVGFSTSVGFFIVQIVLLSFSRTKLIFLEEIRLRNKFTSTDPTGD